MSTGSGVGRVHAAMDGSAHRDRNTMGNSMTEGWARLKQTPVADASAGSGYLRWPEIRALSPQGQMTAAFRVTYGLVYL